MAKQTRVERPSPKSVEYSIQFASRGAAKGWQDLVSTIHNPMVDAWDFLTKTPQQITPTNTRMRGPLAKTDNGFDRWQYKPTAKGGARIWFYVDGQTVYLEQVHTHHPNETK